MSYIIGLTGGICSGKSTISNQFKSLGIPIIDADLIAKNIVNNNLHVFKMIKKRFGKSIIKKNGTLNRKKIRKIIFSNYKEKIWIDNLLHPLIKKEIDKKIISINVPYIIRVSPLLLEKKLEYSVDHVIVIDVKPEEQINRIIKRDNLNKQEAKNILNNQIERTSRLRKADEIIHSIDCIHELKKHILTLHKYYLTLNNSK